MTLRLTVDTAAWRRHVDTVVADVAALSPGVTLVPVVKGNGYGFGRRVLATEAARFADVLAVGTVHELDELPAGVTPVVLTPALGPPAAARAARDGVAAVRPILTVGSRAHVEALAGWQGEVIVKLESSMRRYGGSPELTDQARAIGLEVVGHAIHPPLAGTADEHLDDVRRWLPAIDPDVPVWVSHLAPGDVARLPGSHRYRLRLGTSLWHGDKSMLHLGADVLDTRPVRAGDRAGYRGIRVDQDGTLVMIGAGTAHGVHPLADGRSPFHFVRRRLPLLEPPHMHTSMALVSDGLEVPGVGAEVDVQRPLTTTWVDTVVWA